MKKMKAVLSDSFLIEFEHIFNNPNILLDLNAIEHNDKFYDICQRNIYTNDWYSSYLLCCQIIEDIVATRYIDTNTFREYDTSFSKAIRYFNIIEENVYINDSIIMDIKEFSSSLLSVYDQIKKALSYKYDKNVDVEPIGAIHHIMYYIQYIEKKGLLSVR